MKIFEQFLNSLIGKYFWFWNEYDKADIMIYITNIKKTHHNNWHIHWTSLSKKSRKGRCTPYGKQMKWLDSLREATPEEVEKKKVEVL
jgi:hypothetical protein